MSHTSIIDLTKGTSNKILDIFGKEWIIDLFLDESGKEIVGSALEPVPFNIRWRIVDHNLVEEFTIAGKTVTTISVPAERKLSVLKTGQRRVLIIDLLFDDAWVMSEITGLEAFYANMPPPPPELQKVLHKFMNNEIPMTMVIKTTGDNRYIRRKTG